MEVERIGSPDALDVGQRLGIGRHAVVAVDGTFAGVVGGQHQAHITPVVVEQPAQVGHAAPDVLHRIHDVGDAEALSRFRDDLHEPEGVAIGTGIGVERGFSGHHGQHQARIELVLASLGDDVVDDLGACSTSHRVAAACGMVAERGQFGDAGRSLGRAFLDDAALDARGQHFLAHLVALGEVLGDVAAEAGRTLEERGGHVGVLGNAFAFLVDPA